jgi:hypothetical protein
MTYLPGAVGFAAGGAPELDVPGSTTPFEVVPVEPAAPFWLRPSEGPASAVSAGLSALGEAEAQPARAIREERKSDRGRTTIRADLPD